LLGILFYTLLSMITVRPYAHTISSFIGGLYSLSSYGRLRLCIDSIYNPDDVWYNDVTATIVPNNGTYSSSGIALAYLSRTSYGDNNAQMYHTNSITTTFSTLVSANSALLYTQGTGRLFLHYDFGETIHFAAGTTITFNYPVVVGTPATSGIVNWAFT
jgi:hypothetical protein